MDWEPCACTNISDGICDFLRTNAVYVQCKIQQSSQKEFKWGEFAEKNHFELK